MSEEYLILFFSLFSVTTISIIALSDKKSDIKIENKITLVSDEISSDTKVNINNKKIIDRPAKIYLLFDHVNYYYTIKYALYIYLILKPATTPLLK
ncbi:hypothetical protein ACYUJ6_13885 [Clostridium sp. JNZ X4-2]|uniref:Uncharacterized protein n=1 Tax=Clostridium luticellarii TaxID=1691940 RepID=A0A2T0BD46_9CLOT|nr:hypothetical protein [Clostridium luticellarii]PRR81804.1 hypothetical protein CLLU_30300 [Clostridium luticellarii]